MAWWLVATAVTLAVSQPAWGHAAMVKSSPANNATLSHSPSVIRAWFSEELAAQRSVMRLYDSKQKLLAQGGLDPSVGSHDVMKLMPPRLGPGSYQVIWHAESSDDHAMTQGYFRFSIGTAMQMPPAHNTSTQMGTMQGMPSAGAHGPLPPLQLLAPANHAHLHNPVSVTIETSTDVSLVTMGPKMMTGPGVHLHIVVDGVVNMPASDQLVASGAHRYTYELAPLSPGTHTIKVFWADNRTHAPVGGTQEATVVVL